MCAAHAPWAAEVLQRHPAYAPENIQNLDSAAAAAELDHIIEQEIGAVFARVLEQCAVFADNDEGHEALDRFIASVQ